MAIKTTGWIFCSVSGTSQYEWASIYLSRCMRLHVYICIYIYIYIYTYLLTYVPTHISTNSMLFGIVSDCSLNLQSGKATKQN